MTSKKQSSRTKIFVVVIAVVVAALAVALFVGGPDESTSDVSTSTVVDGGSSGGLPSGEAGENQPVTVTGAALDAFAGVDGDPAVGKAAPALNGMSFDGTPVSVTPGDGRAYMVVFLAHWCPHCNAEIPQLIKWKEAGSVPAGLEVIGISTSVASDRPNYPPSAWTLAAGWPWQVMADSAAMDAAGAYGVTGFPFFAIVGEDGTVKIRVSGEVEPDVLDQILDDVL